ncbi:MAG: heme-binding protein [Amphiplicatus sp.]
MSLLPHSHAMIISGRRHILPSSPPATISDSENTSASARRAMKEHGFMKRPDPANDVFHCAEIQKALLVAAEAAIAFNARISVAIVNSSGVMFGFLRMPGSFLASVDYAQWKAWTAASFDTSTADFASLLKKFEPHVRDGLIAHPKVTALPGGVPIRKEERLIGAIGVSGGSGEQDEEIAQAAVAAFYS